MAPTARKRAPRAPKIPYSPAEIGEIFRRFAVQRPEPQPELEHTNPFTLLVAVVLSAQATDAGVNRATRGLFAKADNAAAMAALGADVCMTRPGLCPHATAGPRDRAAEDARNRTR